MTEPTRTRECLQTLAQVLLRCWLLGFLLLLLWVAAFLLGGETVFRLHEQMFGLSKHELDLIFYCGIGLTKLFVLLFFFFPWLAVRLVLRKM
jgi:hypothetical protein